MKLQLASAAIRWCRHSLLLFSFRSVDYLFQCSPPTKEWIKCRVKARLEMAHLAGRWAVAFGSCRLAVLCILSATRSSSLSGVHTPTICVRLIVATMMASFQAVSGPCSATLTNMFKYSALALPPRPCLKQVHPVNYLFSVFVLSLKCAQMFCHTIRTRMRRRNAQSARNIGLSRKQWKVSTTEYAITLLKTRLLAHQQNINDASLEELAGSINMANLAFTRGAR